MRTVLVFNIAHDAQILEKQSLILDKTLALRIVWRKRTVSLKHWASWFQASSN